MATRETTTTTTIQTATRVPPANREHRGEQRHHDDVDTGWLTAAMTTNNLRQPLPARHATTQRRGVDDMSGEYRVVDEHAATRAEQRCHRDHG